MYAELIDELGTIVGIFGEQDLEPKFVSARFSELIAGDFDDVLCFLENNCDDFSREILSRFGQDGGHKFVATLREGRARVSLEIAITRHPSGDLMIVGRDITEQKKLEYSLRSYSAIMEKQDKLLYEMAYTDALTGVHNRRAVFEKFEAYEKGAANTVGSVCILDIDNFKQFNDRYGHEFGDHVLKYFSTHVDQSIDGDCFFARLGGEEFCVVSFRHTASELGEIIDRVLRTLKGSDVVTPEQRVTQVSFSAGVAEYPKDGATLDELLNNADKALYAAKVSGRARVIAFSTELFETRDDTLIPGFRSSSRP